MSEPNPYQPPLEPEAEPRSEVSNSTERADRNAVLFMLFLFIPGFILAVALLAWLLSSFGVQ